MSVFLVKAVWVIKRYRLHGREGDRRPRDVIFDYFAFFCMSLCILYGDMRALPPSPNHRHKDLHKKFSQSVEFWP
jgi:hypothetical protein